MKISGEMLKLAQHIVETKAGDFDPTEFVDRYEVAVVDLLKKKQSGLTLPKSAKHAPAQSTANVIDLLKRSLELSQKGGKSAKAPSIVPAIQKAKKKQRA